MEVKDARHLEVVEGHSRELMDLITQFNARASGVTDKEELLAIRLEQNAAMVELLRGHRRALQFMAGLPVEPQVHTAEAVLVGVMGGPQ